MKKFIIATVVIFALALAGAYLYFYEGWGGDLFSKDGDVHTFTATEGRTILVDQGDGLKEYAASIWARGSRAISRRTTP